MVVLHSAGAAARACGLVAADDRHALARQSGVLLTRGHSVRCETLLSWLPGGLASALVAAVEAKEPTAADAAAAAKRTPEPLRWLVSAPDALVHWRALRARGCAAR